MIQSIYNCSKFTPNENLNKTCENRTRCIIYYNEYCSNFIEKDCTNCANFQLESIYGVCAIKGILNELPINCNDYKNEVINEDEPKGQG